VADIEGAEQQHAHDGRHDREFYDRGALLIAHEGAAKPAREGCARVHCTQPAMGDLPGHLVSLNAEIWSAIDLKVAWIVASLVALK
jgi:hypothetical protein